MRIGIVGAGGMGAVHARHYRRVPGVELALFDVDSAKAAEFCAKWGATQVDALEALIESADALDLCVPTNLHVTLGLQAIATGKATLIEKPLADTIDGGRQLVRAAEASGAALMVGHVVRYFPEFRRARDLVVSGVIGDPAMARTRRGGLAPKSPWFQNYEASGGVLLDLAIHDFDWLRWTLGEVERVYARSVGLSKGTWPDYALTTLTFESGAIAHVESTWMDPGGGRVTFEVCGSNGMIEHDSRRTQTLRTAIAGAPLAQESPLSPADDPYYNELLDFVACARGEKSPAIAPADAFASLAVALAAVESAKTGQAVRPASLN